MKHMHMKYKGIILSSILGLAACNSGGGDPASNALTAPTGVSLAVSNRSLEFSWTAGSNVDHYRILVNADGASGFSVDAAGSHILGSATSASIEVPVHQTNWLSAQYIVEACDALETTCLASPNQTLSLIDSVAATIYVKASNTDALDNFGWSVSLSDDGNTLAVSAQGEGSASTGVNGVQTDNSLSAAGAVYVFVKSGTSWAQQAYIKASNTENADKFGYMISLSGDGNTLAVSAISEDSNATGVNGNQLDATAPTSGAVYVFVRTGTMWVQQAYVKASNTGAVDVFGRSVSLSNDGNTLAVGAEREDSSTTGVGSASDELGLDAGAVYVFARTGSVWVEEAYIKASNTGAGDAFGWSVSLSGTGNTLAVGAIFEASAAFGVNGNELDNAATDAGAVYVFERLVGVWTQQAYIKASNTDRFDEFGYAVSLSDDGNTLAVGAWGEQSSAVGVGGVETDNTMVASGAVYVFGRTGASWAQQAYVKASNTDASDFFGYAISLSGQGNMLAVGAYGEDSTATGVGGNQADNLGSRSGAVYTYVFSGGAWMQQAYVKPPTNATLDTGWSVSLNADGSSLAAGAIFEQSAATGINGDQADVSANQSGAVYLY